MAKSKSPDIAALLSMVKKAKSDNEKFAALLVVSKMTKADALSAENKKKLFDTIGVEFPLRLLRTSCDGCPENSPAFASIGATVLCAFCLDGSITKQAEMLDAAPLLLRNIDSLQKVPEGKDAIKDCLECLNALASHDAHAEKILNHGGLKVLCSIQTLEPECLSGLFTALLTHHSDMCLEESTIFENYLERLSSDFKDDQSARKFALCKCIVDIVTAIPTSHGLSLNAWIKNVMHALRDILSSKVTVTQRSPALLLSSEMLRLCGIKRFFTSQTEHNLPVVTVRLACIEVGMFLQDLTGDTALEPGPLGLLLACYSIIEAACSCIAQFEDNDSENVLDDVLTFEQIRIVQPALSDVAECVSNFASKQLSAGAPTKNSPQTSLLVGPSIRLLGSWMNIEYNLISSQGRELFLSNPRYMKHIMDTGALELAKAILPAVMKALDNVDMRPKVIDIILPIMDEFLVFALRSVSQENHDLLEAMHLTLQTIIGIVLILSREDITRHCQTVENLSVTVTNAMRNQHNAETSAYFCALSMVLLNLNQASGGEGDPASKEARHTVTLVIDFLKSVNGGDLESNDSLKGHCESIAPLWAICGREMVKLTRRKVWARRLLCESSWSKDITAVTTSAKTVVDEDVSEIFSDLLKVIENA